MLMLILMFHVSLNSPWAPLGVGFPWGGMDRLGAPGAPGEKFTYGAIQVKLQKGGLGGAVRDTPHKVKV